MRGLSSGVPAPLTVIKDIDVLRRQRVFVQVKGNPMLVVTLSPRPLFPGPPCPRAEDWEVGSRAPIQAELLRLHNPDFSSPEPRAGVGRGCLEPALHTLCPVLRGGLAPAAPVAHRVAGGMGCRHCQASVHIRLIETLLPASWVGVGWGELTFTAPLERQDQAGRDPRDPGPGQGQVHLCHSGPCTNVTFSESPP